MIMGSRLDDIDILPLVSVHQQFFVWSDRIHVSVVNPATASCYNTIYH